MKIKKALLFVPPALTFKNNLDVNPVPPLGLGYIAAVLQQKGIEVKIFDCLMQGWDRRERIHDNLIKIGSSSEDIRKEISSFGPDLVGINCLFTRQRESAHSIVRIAKELNPSIITVMGGAHPTVLPELVLSDKNVDFVVLGEGEQIITELIEALENGRDLAVIDGIGFRKDGKVCLNKRHNFIENIDEIAFPARELFSMDKYFDLGISHGRRRKRRFSPIVTSRGCPAGCVFCTAHHVWGRKYRVRSVENVISEMRQLKEKFNIEELIFEDDNVTLDIRRAEQLFDSMIREKFNFAWDTPNGVAAFALNEKLIDKMK
ncbi:MAG TPA: B12-binding domain-containing radical SAM protein, partial [Candidatus Omnitrophica bacterium]|nr:B12-binding domain-containing radical SAM protein [Candidatus Omnitrophota bacterium]